jgi:cation diffusion facilitator CzcD-associated flavoprotein CzcO
MEDFKGTIVHSHDYRVPDPFKDKVVVCLGGAASGQDICLDIATQAKQVHYSSAVKYPA